MKFKKFGLFEDMFKDLGIKVGYKNKHTPENILENWKTELRGSKNVEYMK